MPLRVVDGYFTPLLVPSILIANTLKLFSMKEKVSPMYTTITLGTTISFLSIVLQHHMLRSVKSRSHQTLLTALLLTTITVSGVCGFNVIRNNHDKVTYQAPSALRYHKINSLSTMFRYHFFLDIIPGILILLQSILDMMINFNLLHKAKRKFTFGEATILSQLASAAFLTWALTVYTRLIGAGPFQVSLTDEILLNIGSCLFFIAFLPVYLFGASDKSYFQMTTVVTSIAVSFTLVKNIISNHSELDPLTWFATYLFDRHQRISLFSLWISILTGCISLSTLWSRLVGSTSSLIRKTFHLAISVVFITGYNQDIDFTRFAAGGILCIMFLLELCRAWQLKYIGPRLETICKSLRGKWDNRFLTVSHMYLLVGAFIPLWLTPPQLSSSNKLFLSSGLISLGVGDTCAAIIGGLSGRRIINKSSDKTLEGLIANMLSMIIFKIIWVGYIDLVSEFSFVIVAFLTASVEAVIRNCDNLVLPLTMMVLLNIF